MKRQRRSVSIDMVPSGGRFQTALLRPTIPTNLPVFLNSDIVNTVFGPVLIDLDNSCIVDYIHGHAFAGLKVQDTLDSVGRENPFFHSCAYGHLKSDDGSYATPCKREWIDTDSHLNYDQDFTIVRTIDSMGRSLEEIWYYEQEGLFPSRIESESSPLCAGFRLTMRDSDTDFLLRSTIAEGSNCVTISWDPLNEDNVDITTLEFSIQPRMLVDRSRQTVTVPCRISQEIASQPDMFLDAYPYNWECDVLYISPVIVTTGSTDSNMDALVREVEGVLNADLVELSRVESRDNSFGAVADSVIGLKHLQLSGLAFAKELLALKELVEPAVKLLKKPWSLKNWAGLLLWWRYGVRLGVKDWMDLIKAIRQIRKTCTSLRGYAKMQNSTLCRYGTSFLDIASPKWVGRSRANARIVVRLEVPIAETALSGLMSLMHNLDFDVTAVNLWDLVSYSFVLDWFIDVGSLLAKVDFSHSVSELRLRELVESTHNISKTHYATYFERLRLVGEVTLDTYWRKVSTEFPKPPVSVGTSTYSNHLFEGALLILGKQSQV